MKHYRGRQRVSMVLWPSRRIVQGVDCFWSEHVLVRVRTDSSRPNCGEHVLDEVLRKPANFVYAEREVEVGRERVLAQRWIVAGWLPSCARAVVDVRRRRPRYDPDIATETKPVRRLVACWGREAKPPVMLRRPGRRGLHEPVRLFIRNLIRRLALTQVVQT